MGISSLFYINYVDYAVKCVESNEIKLSDELDILNFCLNCLNNVPVSNAADRQLLLGLVGRIGKRVSEDAKKISGVFKANKTNRQKIEILERKIDRLSRRIEFPETSAEIRKKWKKAFDKAKVIGRGTAINPSARLLKESYWVEALPITLPAAYDQTEQKVHLYKEKAHEYMSKWKSSYMDKMSFEEFMYRVVGPKLSLQERNDLIDHDVVYVDEAARINTAVAFVDGQATHNGKAIPPGEYMFVLDAASEVLHIGKKIQSIFHHSSFERGGAVASAGMIMIGDQGKILQAFPYSGHYRPRQAEMDALRRYLEERLGKIESAKIDFVSHGSVKDYLTTLGQLFAKYTHKRH